MVTDCAVEDSRADHCEDQELDDYLGWGSAEIMSAHVGVALLTTFDDHFV